VFQAGGFLTLLMTAILLVKARNALTKDYKKTEMWLILPKDFRPPERYAQWVTATVMRDAYFTFAQYTALISIAMWMALGRSRYSLAGRIELLRGGSDHAARFFSGAKRE
jgi:hypothetical protein